MCESDQEGSAVQADGFRAEFKASLQEKYARLKRAGLPGNTAAACALKWAAGTVAPVELSHLQTLADQRPVSQPALHALGAQLFKCADTLFMTLVLHFPDRSAPDGAPSGRLDLSAAADCFGLVCPAPASPRGAADPAAAALADLLQTSLPRGLPYLRPPQQAELLCALLLLPPLQEVESHDPLFAPLLTLFAAHLARLDARLRAEFARLPTPLLRAAVFALQQFLTLRLYRQRALDPLVRAAVTLLDLLHAANRDSPDPVHHSLFYNDVVNSPDFDLSEDWRRSRREPPSFAFCRYPFLFGPAAKARLMTLRSAQSQMAEISTSILNAPAGGDLRPFLVLQVRRGPDLVHDALTQLNAALRRGSLKKPLKVKFVGEQGVDEGGVAKEFFQLVVQACFSPNFGMFTRDGDTNLHWFRASHIDDLASEFELVGIVIALAVYNSHILDCALPLAVYKKLLGQPVGLEDLRSVHPDVYTSLRRLLEYPAADVEADMGLTFQVSHEVDFCAQTHDLIPDGAAVPVTGANRDDFVAAYADFLLNCRIEPQFAAFKTGFCRLFSAADLAMLHVSELELVVCGSQDLDFGELERVAAYDGGYSRDSPVVRWFWDAVAAFPLERRRRLLQFVTSSERAPIGGLAALAPRFRIVKNGGDSDRLPTSHTCFNILLLPEYGSRERLEDRLVRALDNSHGFGLM